MSHQLFKSKSEFTVIRTLGEGGFGRAWSGKHYSDLCTIYVVKEVNLTKLKHNLEGVEQRKSDRILEMTLTEHEKMKSFQHPNIVLVYGSFKEHIGPEDFYFLVLEYCEGGDLDRYIREMSRNGHFIPEEQLRSWSSQLISALRYMHQSGHVHRDIKPKNIMLTGDRQKVKLGDFGLAKNLEEQQSAVSATGAGTFSYWSPEVLNNIPYGKPADVWSLGITLYEAANWHRPFTNGGMEIVSIMTQPPEPFESRSPYSAEYRNFVFSMLEKNPDLRPSISQLFDSPFFGVNSKFSNPSPPKRQPGSGLLRKSPSVEVPPAPLSAVSTGSSVSSRSSTFDMSKYGAILKSDLIEDTYKDVIIEILRESFVTPEQLREYSDEDLKELFPQIGLRNVVNKWRRGVTSASPASASNLKTNEKPQPSKTLQAPAMTAALPPSMPPRLSTPLPANVLAKGSTMTEAEIAAARGQAVQTILQMARDTWLFARIRQDCKGGDIDGIKGIVRDLMVQFPESIRNDTTIYRQLFELPNEEELGATPLHDACWNGHTAIVHFLVEMLEVNVYARLTDPSASMPVHIAAQRGFAPIVKILVSKHPKLVNETNGQQKTPLLLAIQHGNWAVVAYFVGDLGLGNTRLGEFSRTPLHLACDLGHLEMVEWLVRSGRCDLKATDQSPNESAPIHLAAAKGFAKIVAKMVEVDASQAEIKDKKGRTPKVVASKHDKKEVVALFKSK